MNRFARPGDQSFEANDWEPPMRKLLLGIALSALLAAPALACGAGSDMRSGGPHIPPLAAAIDDLLPQADLSATDLDKVKVLRAKIKEAAAAGKEEAAREAEAQAMAIMGYKKAWLACGPGTFIWMKLST
jgi:hypothetical protein